MVALPTRVGDSLWSISVRPCTSSVFGLMIACTRAVADWAQFFVVVHHRCCCSLSWLGFFAVDSPSRLSLCSSECLLMSLEGLSGDGQSMRSCARR